MEQFVGTKHRWQNAPHVFSAVIRIGAHECGTLPMKTFWRLSIRLLALALHGAGRVVVNIVSTMCSLMWTASLQCAIADPFLQIKAYFVLPLPRLNDC